MLKRLEAVANGGDNTARIAINKTKAIAIPKRRSTFRIGVRERCPRAAWTAARSNRPGASLPDSYPKRAPALWDCDCLRLVDGDSGGVVAAVCHRLQPFQHRASGLD